MYVNSNAAAINAWWNLNQSTNAMENTLAQLASGYKINNAGDNPAMLAIAQNMQAQSSAMAQGSQNAQQGISLLQTQDGGLAQIQNILQSMYTLAVQYSNGTMSTTDQAAITAELYQYQSEITQIASTTTFNGISLLNQHVTITIQFGSTAKDNLPLTSVSASATALSVNLLANYTVASKIQAAINQVSAMRGSVGASLNRLQFAYSDNQVISQNLNNARSGIMDTDMAQAMATLSQQQVLQQSGVAMLAQANTLPQSLLKLLT